MWNLLLFSMIGALLSFLSRTLHSQSMTWFFNKNRSSFSSIFVPFKTITNHLERRVQFFSLHCSIYCSLSLSLSRLNELSVMIRKKEKILFSLTRKKNRKISCLVMRKKERGGVFMEKKTFLLPKNFPLILSLTISLHLFQNTFFKCIFCKLEWTTWGMERESVTSPLSFQEGRMIRKRRVKSEKKRKERVRKRRKK